jgi:peroxiredoxin
VQELKGLPAGAFLSDFALPDLAGAIVRVSDLVGASYLLLFVSRDCRPSAEVLSHLESLRAMSIEMPRVVVICSGGVDAARTVAGRHHLGTDVAIQDEEEVSLFMRVPATPAAYRVNADRTTAGPLAIGADAVIALLPQVVTPFETGSMPPVDEPRATPIVTPIAAGRVGLPVGAFAPELPTAAESSEAGSIAGNRGRWKFLLFWTPDCTPCDELAGSVADLATASPQLAVVVVARGTDHDTRALAETLRPEVQVLRQEARAISRQYVAFDAPAAYLIDPEGRIAEPLARGRLAVEQLLQKSADRFSAS